jgi:hypothetical protein
MIEAQREFKYRVDEFYIGGDDDEEEEDEDGPAPQIALKF